MLKCAGEEDRASQCLRRRALMLAMRSHSDVTVDLRELAYADISLIVDLAALSQRLRRRGKALVLSGAQPQLTGLIESAGLDRLPGVRVKQPPPPVNAAA